MENTVPQWPMPHVPVMLSGAPRTYLRLRESGARSRNTPTMSPSPCRVREFSSMLLRATRLLRNGFYSPFYQPEKDGPCRKDEPLPTELRLNWSGESWDALWGEFPESAFPAEAFSGCFDSAPVSFVLLVSFRRSAQHDRKKRDGLKIVADSKDLERRFKSAVAIAAFFCRAMIFENQRRLKANS